MKKFILVSLMIGCMGINSAYAGELNIKQENSGQVTVNAVGFEENSQVALTVYSEIKQDGETKKYIKQLAQTKSDASGNAVFEFKFFATDPIATYILSVQDESMTDYAETAEIEFKNQLAVDLVNNAKNETELLEVLKKNGTALNIDTSLLTEENQERVAKKLFEKKLNYTADNFGDFKELYFDIAITDLLNGKNAAELEEFFEKYSCGADVSAESDYSKLSETGKKELLERIAAKTFANVSEIEKEWKEQLGLTIIKTVKYPAMATWFENGESLELKEDYSEILGFGGGKYSLLKDKNAPYKELAGKDFKNSQEAKAEFETACQNQYKAENKQTGSSGGSGGSGGGGGFPAMVLNPENTSKTDTEKKEYYIDIDEYTWAKEAIEKLSDKQVISGTGNGMFMPDKAVTREEFLKMLILALDIPIITSEKAFTDVPKGAWYEEYVQTGVEVGIINGMGEDIFGSGISVTREDMTVMIERVSKISGIELKAVKEKIAFSDEGEISEYAKTSVEKVQMAGVINGYADSSFKPKKTATRAESAVVIYKLINLK